VILMWIFTLWWGERTVFQEHIDACVWDNWEHWVGLGVLRSYMTSTLISFKTDANYLRSA